MDRFIEVIWASMESTSSLSGNSTRCQQETTDHNCMIAHSRALNPSLGGFLAALENGNGACVAVDRLFVRHKI